MAFMLCGSKQLHASLDSLALQQSRQAFMAQKNLPEVNQDVEWMDAFMVIIPRGKKGFGFTVTGACPVRVGQVKEGSPACIAGLQKDDTIVKINGKNVSRSIADTVAKIVRNSEIEVTLECYRPYESVTNDQCVPAARPWSPYSPPSHVYQQQQSAVPLSPTSQVVPSPISSPVSDYSASPLTYAVQAEVHAVPQKGEAEGGVARAINLEDWQHEDDLYQRTSTPSRPLVTYLNLTEQEQQRQTEICHLLRLEQDFVKSMQFGIERYLQPLRYSVVAPGEHCTLFQNLEKLVAMAEFNSRLLQRHGVQYCEVELDQQQYLDSVGMLYQRHVPMLCEAYETYCAGAKSAIRLLAELKKDESFQSFLKNPALIDGQQSLGTFLQKPIQHMKDLVVQLQAVYTHSSASHQDQAPLKNVIQALRRSCSSIYQNNTRLCRSTFSLASAQSSTSLLSETRFSSSSVCNRIPSPLPESDLRGESESMCSFASKTFSDHSDSSEKSSKSQDSGISVRKSPSEGANTSSSPSSSPSTSTAAESGFSSSFCGRCSNGSTSAQQVPEVKHCNVQGSVIQSIHSEPADLELSSIDSEVLDIQSRLLFGNDIQSFRIASSTRHMIYAGDLMYCSSQDGADQQWETVYVVLLSDLLLITRVECDNYLTVIEEPIVLQDVAAAAWTCRYERDFQLTVTCDDCGAGAAAHDPDNCRTTFTFRAPTPELKHTWENIVDQRIVACKTQPERDNMFGKVIAEFI